MAKKRSRPSAGDLPKGTFTKEVEAISGQSIAQEVQENIDQRRDLYFSEDLAPNLDPSSPEFDAAAFSEAAREAEKAIFAAMTKNQSETALDNAENLTPAIIISANEELKQATFAPLRFFAQEGKAAARAIGQALKDAGEAMPKYSAEFVEAVADLDPYLRIELEDAAADDPDIAQYTIWDVYDQGFDESGKPINSIFSAIIYLATVRKKEYEATEEHTAVISVLQGHIERLEHEAAQNKVTTRRTENLGLSLDKLSLITFGNNDKLIPNKQLKIDTLGDKQYPVLYFMDFDGLDTLGYQTTKELDYYDEFVASVANGLRENFGIFSESQVCKVMRIGNNQRNRESVRKSMDKMRLTLIEINSLQEAQHSNYPAIKYDGAVLPFERVTATINGKPTASAIRLLDEPPLTRFAREHKQITAISLDVLDVPIKKTRRNLGLIIFLAKRISHVKKGYGNPTILKASLYAEFKIKRNHQKEFIEAVQKTLFHFKREKFITNYTEAADSFHVFVSAAIEGSEAPKKIADKKKKS